MPIVSQLSQVMAKRGIGTVKLAAMVGIAPVNLSRFKTGQVKSIRFSTLGSLCEELNCQPGDLLGYISEEPASTHEKLNSTGALDEQVEKKRTT